VRRLLPILLVPLALLVAACGGGSKSSSGGGSVPAEDAAVVAGTPITRARLDRTLQQVKCSFEQQKRAFPKPGTSEYQTLQAQALQSLVQQAELEQEAPKLGVSVSAKQVDSRLKALKKQYFGGNEKQYRSQIKKDCFTDQEVRTQLHAQLVSEAIYKKLTSSVKVSDAEVRQYYDLHREVYTQPQTRIVRHILVKQKSLADRLYTQLKHGADFAALARKYSQDPGSKAQGGRMTISRGETVKPFDNVAFTLKTGQISKPVHTQFGWHIIQALAPTKGRTSTPFAQVKESIRQQLLQQKRTEAVQTWLNGVKKDYATKVKYAPGLAPTTTAATTTTG
jgi:parvulin-like peptidyl-prolyl isomerase